MTPKLAIALHSLLLAVGTGIATFLMAAFASGVPTTKAAWHALWLGCAAAGLSRLFGWMLNRLQDASGGTP